MLGAVQDRFIHESQERQPKKNQQLKLEGFKTGGGLKGRWYCRLITRIQQKIYKNFGDFTKDWAQI